MAKADIREPVCRKRRMVAFALSGRAYAVPLEAVQEIVPMALLSQPAGMPEVLAGFLNLRGTAVAVLRLSRLFGLAETSPSLYTPLLILRGTGLPLALLVDRVSGIVAVSEQDILPLRENCTFNDCTEGVTMVNKSLMAVLSPERILLGNERRRLAEFQARQTARLAVFEEPHS